MSGVSRRGRSRLQLLGAALVASAVVLVLGLRPTATDASWTSAEYSGAIVGTARIPAPTMTSCVASTTLGLDPQVAITWQFPPQSGYTASANARYWYATGGLLANLTTALLGDGVATTGSGTYTTTYSGALLSGVLGSSVLVGVSTTVNGWTSPASVAVASFGLLGTNPTCTIQPPASG
jgi:hypothetical protein